MGAGSKQNLHLIQMSVSSGFPSAAVLQRKAPPSQLFADCNRDPLVAAALKTLNLCPTAFNTLFFSRSNMETIQTALRNRIKARLGFVIDRQDDNALCVIMRAMYNSYGREPPCTDFDVVAAHVAQLNGVVMRVIYRQVSSGVVSDVNYLRDASQLPNPIPLPVATSNAGTKNLPIFSGI